MDEVKSGAETGSDKLFLDSILQHNLKSGQYFEEKFDKIQVYLHATAGRCSGQGTIDGWAANEERVGTSVVVSRGGTNKYYGDIKDGQIVQAFPFDCWAYHLGVPENMFSSHGLKYVRLDKKSIGIEIANAGALTKTDRGFETWFHEVVPDIDVVEIKHRNLRYWQKITDAQVESIRKLLIHFNRTFGIPISYMGDDIFDIDERALKEVPGVYTHCSVAYWTTRVDIPPQKEVVDMLKSL